MHHSVSAKSMWILDLNTSRNQASKIASPVSLFFIFEGHPVKFLVKSKASISAIRYLLKKKPEQVHFLSLCQQHEKQILKIRPIVNYILYLLLFDLVAGCLTK